MQFHAFSNHTQSISIFFLVCGPVLPRSNKAHSKACSLAQNTSFQLFFMRHFMVQVSSECTEFTADSTSLIGVPHSSIYPVRKWKKCSKDRASRYKCKDIYDVFPKSNTPHKCKPCQIQPTNCWYSCKLGYSSYTGGILPKRLSATCMGAITLAQV